MDTPNPFEGDLPPELWIGKIMDRQWSILAWTSPQQAAQWLAEPGTREKRLWHVRIERFTELTLTPHVERKLVERTDDE